MKRERHRSHYFTRRASDINGCFSSTSGDKLLSLDAELFTT